MIHMSASTSIQAEYILVEKTTEVAVRVQQLQLRGVVHSCDGVGEGVDESRESEVEDEALGEVAVLLVQDNDCDHCQAAHRGECADARSNSSHCNILGTVEAVEAAPGRCCARMIARGRIYVRMRARAGDSAHYTRRARTQQWRLGVKGSSGIFPSPPE